MGRKSDIRNQPIRNGTSVIDSLTSHMTSLFENLTKYLVLVFPTLIKRFLTHFLSILSLIIISNQILPQYSSTSRSSALSAHNSNTIMYRIVDCECAELVLNNRLIPFSKKFGNMKCGNCSSEGFTKFHRFQNIKFGPFGLMKLAVYKQNNDSTESL